MSDRAPIDDPDARAARQAADVRRQERQAQANRDLSRSQIVPDLLPVYGPPTAGAIAAGTWALLAGEPLGSGILAIGLGGVLGLATYLVLFMVSWEVGLRWERAAYVMLGGSSIIAAGVAAGATWVAAALLG